MLVLDLDGFKPINDTYGHQAGDIVLSEIGKRLNAIKRETDVLCRLGGDEFALLAPDADVSEAGVIAERMRKEIICPICIGDADVIVDVSIGIAMAEENTSDASGLLKLADEAMYETKRHKKNPVLLAPEDKNKAMTF